MLSTKGCWKLETPGSGSPAWIRSVIHGLWANVIKSKPAALEVPATLARFRARSAYVAPGGSTRSQVPGASGSAIPSSRASASGVRA